MLPGKLRGDSSSEGGLARERTHAREVGSLAQHSCNHTSISACFAAIAFMLARATEFHFVTSISVALLGSRRDLEGVIVVPYMDHTRSIVDEQRTTRPSAPVRGLLVFPTALALRTGPLPEQTIDFDHDVGLHAVAVLVQVARENDVVGSSAASSSAQSLHRQRRVVPSMMRVKQAFRGDRRRPMEKCAGEGRVVWKSGPCFRAFPNARKRGVRK